MMMAEREVIFELASPKFKCLWDMPHKYRHFVFHSGRSTAKGHSVARYILWACHNYKTRVLCCREVQKSIRESSHRLFRDLIDKYKLNDLFEITDAEIRHIVTGSLITFTGLHSNIDSVKSTEGIDICWVDESQSVSQESIDVLIPTIRKSRSIIIWTLNPRLEIDPVYATFISNPRPDTLVIKLNLEDNRFLPDTIRKESELMKETDYEMWRWVYGGECVGHEENTLILPNWVENSRKRIPICSEDDYKIAGCDVARMGSDQTIFTLRQGNRILVVKSFDKGDTVDVANWLEQQYLIHQPDCMVVDASGSAGQYDILRRSIGHIVPIIDYVGSASAFDNTYYNSRAECWDKMAMWIRTNGQLPHHNFNYLSDVHYEYRNDKKLIEKKEFIKARIGKSPDEEDSLSLTFHPYCDNAIRQYRMKHKKVEEENYSYGFCG